MSGGIGLAGCEPAGIEPELHPSRRDRHTRIFSNDACEGGIPARTRRRSGEAHRGKSQDGKRDEGESVHLGA